MSIKTHADSFRGLDFSAIPPKPLRNFQISTRSWICYRWLQTRANNSLRFELKRVFANWLFDAFLRMMRVYIKTFSRTGILFLRLALAQHDIR